LLLENEKAVGLKGKGIMEMRMIISPDEQVNEQTSVVGGQSQ